MFTKIALFQTNTKKNEKNIQPICVHRLYTTPCIGLLTIRQQNSENVWSCFRFSLLLRTTKFTIVDNFIVSARKYRPATFDTVIGQKGLTTTLKNAIQENKLAHAYLFCGPRGVGKTTCARIFAKTINCEHLSPEGEACNECESCRAFDEGRSYNIHELDAASNNSVDDIRSLIDQVRIPPQIGRYKVFIIDEVHMLSTAAFNAFLKTLEEPPSYAKFILATTERHKVLPTILSRCQVYDFYRIGLNDIVDHLRNVAAKEGVTAEEEALMVIAQKADGGMRDALSLFDQMVSYSQGHLTYKNVIDNLNILDYEYFFRFTDMFLENKTSDCILLFNEILQRGFDGGNFIGGLASHLRDLLVSRDEVTLPLLDVSNEMRSRYQAQAQKCPQKFLFKAIKLCNDCDLSYKASKNKRLLVELTLIQLSQLTVDSDDGDCSGRRPKHLKPIFGTASAVPSSQPKNSTPVAPTSSAIPSTPASHSTTSTQTAAGSPTATAPTVARPSNAVPSQTPPSAVSRTVTRTGSAAPTRRGLGTISILNPYGTTASTAESTDAQPTQTTTTASRATVEQKNRAVTDEEVQIAWKTFTRQLPREDIAMGERMNAMRPTLGSDGKTFKVNVSNKLVEDDLHKMKPRIEAFIRQELQNSTLTLAVTVVEAAVTARLLTPREQFEVMLQQNASLKVLTDEFDLDLV